MKRLELIVLIFSFCGVAFAQDTTRQPQPRWGIGISVSGNTGVIFVPIEVSQRFRLEPEFDVYRGESRRRDYSSTQTNLSVGSGFFAMTRTGNVNVYYGARLTITSMLSTWKDRGEPDERSGSGFSVGGVVGGEYFLGDRFTLGGEARLIVSYLRRYGDSTVFRTRGLGLLRYYF